MRTLPRRKAALSRFFAQLLLWLGLLAVVMGLSVGGWGYWNRHWDGKTRFTVIPQGSPVQIKSFDPVAKQGIILTLPDNLEITGVRGRGTWLAGVVFQAGKKEWAADSIAYTLGISYTGTDFGAGWWDAWQWNKQSQSVQWKEVRLADTNLLEKVATPDGIEVYRLGSNADAQLRDWFSDQAIAVESLGIAIVNTTSEPGLGAQAGRVVESMGLKVRELTNAEKAIGRCVLRGTKSLQKSLAAEKVRQVFNCVGEESQDEDLVLLLGTEYVEWLSGE